MMVRDRSRSVKALTPVEIRDEGVDVLFLVWLTARAATDLLDPALAVVGLTGEEYAIYSMLAATGTITPTELARWMAAPPTTVSSFVKRFESRGHVRRTANPDDRRSYRIELTPAGKRAHRAAATIFTPMRSQIQEALGPQAEAIKDALLALRTTLDVARGAPAPPP